MLPILTVGNIDSHEPFFRNDYFECFSSVSNEWVILSIYPFIDDEISEISEIGAFIDDKITDFINQSECFIFDKLVFGFAIYCKANDLDFDLINDFFVNLIDEMNSIFGD